MSDLIHYNLPYELDYVPTTCGGLYYFSIRFPTNYELGLANGHEVNIDHVLRIMSERIALLTKVKQGAEFLGEISNQKAKHIRTAYLLKAELSLESVVLSDFINERTTKLCENTLIDIANLLRVLFVSSPPIYIGLTRGQSFASRLEQHLVGQTGVADQLKENKMEWNDLRFSIIEVKTKINQNLRVFEKVFQSIYHPVFSIN